MPRGLDHVVHAVADLDAAADFYRRCGFKVGVRNRHPWGTHNHIVQLSDFYIEILTVAEPEKIVAHAARSFSFGAFHRDRLAHAEGLDMVLLSSDDAIADAASFKTSGIGDFEVFEFAREGSRPDGTQVKLAFSLTFARDTKSPEVGFATCQHHVPENFWDLEFQKHANGAMAMAGMVMIAAKPIEHAAFLKAFTGVDQIEERVSGFVPRTPRGEIETLEPQTFKERYGMRCKSNEGLTMTALRIGVGRLDDVESVLREGDVPLHRHGALLCVPPQAAFGATLIFEQADIA